MWNPFGGNTTTGDQQPQEEVIQEEVKETDEEIARRKQAEEDIKYWISGQAFETDDAYILYFRKVTGIVATQMALTLGLGFIQVKSGILNFLFET